MSYVLNENNLFSVIFETHLSSIVSDEKPAGLPESYNYTLEQANIRYQEITGKNDLGLIFNANTQFKFNNYSKGGYYENSAKLELSYPLVRNFSSDNFKTQYKSSSTPLTSINPLTVKLNYQITKKGFNFENADLAQRNKNKATLNDLLNKGKITDGSATYASNKDLFPRILKIMTFILARERGSNASANGSSEELMHREYGLICWSIINAAAKNRFNCGNNILKLLQNKAYTNPKQDNNKYHISDKNDVIDNTETDIMKPIYTARVQNINLQLFVMAFWDGYINEELPGVTNWDHVSSKGASFVFRGFHLPKSLRNTPDPDVGKTINITLDNGQQIANVEISEDAKFNIANTSNDDTFTLDGNVLFTKN